LWRHTLSCARCSRHLMRMPVQSSALQDRGGAAHGGRNAAKRATQHTTLMPRCRWSTGMACAGPGFVPGARRFPYHSAVASLVPPMPKHQPPARLTPTRGEDHHSPRPRKVTAFAANETVDVQNGESTGP